MAEQTAQASRLRITEIFYSLQGETRSVGLPTVFVRLTGCPLRCVYCDTAYAFSGGEWQSIAEIREQVAAYGADYVTVTGGEPLAQKACLELLIQLCDDGYEVSLETSGAMDISQVDPRVVRVVDIKTPGSGEVSRNLYSNFDHLTARDQLKFVICDAEDYQWCLATMAEYQLHDKCEILFSPSHEQLEARELAEWVLRDRLAVRLQIQLHKYLWGNRPGC
jgi:7-carboxy-7-deazaguanine synthase